MVSWKFLAVVPSHVPVSSRWTDTERLVRTGSVVVGTQCTISAPFVTIVTVRTHLALIITPEHSAGTVTGFRTRDTSRTWGHVSHVAVLPVLYVFSVHTLQCPWREVKPRGTVTKWRPRFRGSALRTFQTFVHPFYTIIIYLTIYACVVNFRPILSCHTITSFRTRFGCRVFRAINTAA